MSLGTYNCQTTGFFYSGTQLDIGSTAGHVGGNGYGSGQACFCNHIGFLFMEFGIQYIMLDIFSS